MLNRSASFTMSTSILKALPGKLDIKRHSPSILYLLFGALTIKFNFYKLLLVICGYYLLYLECFCSIHVIIINVRKTLLIDF